LEQNLRQKLNYEDKIRTNVGQITNDRVIMGKWGTPRKQSKHKQISKKSN
jgi:hypothetical protein